MGYTLVTANRNYSSWSLRPWVLMRALGIAFEDRIEPFLAPENYDAFRLFSPTGQVPVLIDGERTVWDSLGIALYLAERHDGVWPSDGDARAWAVCAAAEMHGGFAALRNERTMNVGVRVDPVRGSDALDRNVARVTELWAEGLDRFGGPWLAGADFTAVDAFFAPVAFRVRTYGIDVGPQGLAWVERIIAHPAMREWEDAALGETWREAGHEAELAASGSITADFRR
ncbi:MULTISPECIES: glutathione S-transferase family protein [unclassified Sphingomonas]|jgi:glutathione S-transferase|uniref:glutathione S-transferase family protein n=1 Tax=unclassified Sphingomonas TaxID=196159 RepID=UPI0004DF8B36|nr:MULTISPECIES: glutathione S-transferase family protein [unclassified Sphingomonas]KHA65247.1 glutathione S-transferase [Sphingomonas sp. Ant20]MBD8468949.1 glutathione S-transferase family protein [Sphingomonas sp. CFBP 8765]MDY1008538.1 glutathione S-transferase family protein [Sphingomonas sp. CFBP9019]